MKKLLLTLLLFSAGTGISAAKTYDLKSPDGKIAVRVDVGADAVTYSISRDGKELIAPSPLSLTLADGRVLGRKASVRKASAKSVDEIIEAPFYKRSAVEDRYNSLTLTFKGDYGIDFRAYDDGAGLPVPHLDEGRNHRYGRAGGHPFPGGLHDADPLRPRRQEGTGAGPLLLQQLRKHLLHPARLEGRRRPPGLPAHPGRRRNGENRHHRGRPGGLSGHVPLQPHGGKALRGNFAPYPGPRRCREATTNCNCW